MQNYLCGSDGRPNVMRRPGERYAQSSTQERVAYGEGSIMFWGRLCVIARTELIFICRVRRNQNLNVARYITDILVEYVMPFAGYIRQNFRFLQDDAKPTHLMSLNSTWKKSGSMLLSRQREFPTITP
ncbi:hypothetical protein EVAR_26805_1 [Eumeta japonica]|uniref:Uncharacterized protein n=1 Tax=Eumeta variegata TaxID=151549 RepID=A0A4C1WG42_EUMVA|nr:hypothetical protein EVAR_26805_1 [Eumeta japonica]